VTDGASDGEEEELTFNVEKITEHKGVRPRKFLVHWEGYPPGRLRPTSVTTRCWRRIWRRFPLSSRR
jgi:hypothetical protein